MFATQVSNMPPKPPGSDSPTQTGAQQHFEFPPSRPLLQVASKASAYTDDSCFNFDKIQYEYSNPFKLRVGSQRKSPGFHAELVCLTPWVNGVPPSNINCLQINTNFGLMAYGKNFREICPPFLLMQNFCWFCSQTSFANSRFKPYFIPIPIWH